MRHLALLADETTPVADSPEGHVRNAIQCIILAESRVAALLIPPDAATLELLRAAEARCFRALFDLGQDTLRGAR